MSARSNSREFWLNGNNWHSIDTKPFNCDDLIHLREVDPEWDALVEEILEAYQNAVQWAMEGRDWNPISDVLLLAKLEALNLRRSEASRTTGKK